MSVIICRLGGAEITDALEDLAALRIRVFADYPYLYDGDAAYEAEYLAEFAVAPGAVLIGAFDGVKLVGAATASPMWAQKEAFRAPFERAGLDTQRLFYFGESVLLPEYRGQGIGHAFFDQREAAALAADARQACFASVIRADDHPARPENYRPLDSFWIGCGYAPVPGLITELDWKEHGEAGESTKPLQNWLRTFERAPE
ncbi:GNAT family N-acetyltransferase [Altericroceibacterium endophyticum]|uniref:GNAT family N-acetyltransferase n=1 Tax=Altericroceibacterium endophyticum TaxID=1808508 RepID=A0A6I4T684_9SPHN|nr:GNAT family N-acetyltransferase [Altericroceibacterium endophyticum]MXO66188.1 GNAT family N-acetyltransferase [Altericroceibacterium endophyticum]